MTTRTKPRRTTQARIEDLEFLVGQGVPIHEAVERAGWTLDGAEITLRRYGHPLAAAVTRERDQQRKTRATRPERWRRPPVPETRTAWLDTWRQA